MPVRVSDLTVRWVGDAGMSVSELLRDGEHVAWNFLPRAFASTEGAYKWTMFPTEEGVPGSGGSIEDVDDGILASCHWMQWNQANYTVSASGTWFTVADYGFPRDVTAVMGYTMLDLPERSGAYSLTLNINNSQRKEYVPYDAGHYTVGDHTLRVDAAGMEGNPDSGMMSVTLNVYLMEDGKTPVRVVARHAGMYPTEEYERMAELGVACFDGETIRYV